MTGRDQSTPPPLGHAEGQSTNPLVDDEKVNRLTLLLEEERRARARILPRTPALNAAIRRHSSISDVHRRRVGGALKYLEAHPGREGLQRTVTAIKAPLTAVYQTSTANALEIGEWLHAIKRLTPYGLFSASFKKSANALEDPLPMSLKMGQMFMRVAAHPYIREPKNWKHLPLGNVSTLDVMLRAAPDNATLAQLVATGRIHPQMTQNEAKQLRAPRWGAQEPMGDPMLGIHRAVQRLLREHPQARPELLAYLRRQLAQLEAADATPRASLVDDRDVVDDEDLEDPEVADDVDDPERP